MRDVARTGALGIAQWAVIGTAASPLGIELTPELDVVTGDTQAAVAEFAGAPNSGLIVGVSAASTIQRQLIIELAKKHKLPTVYPYRFFVEAGGLMSYGPNLIDGYRRLCGLVMRLL